MFTHVRTWSVPGQEMSRHTREEGVPVFNVCGGGEVGSTEPGPEAGGACSGSGGSGKLFLAIASQAPSWQHSGFSFSWNRSESTNREEVGPVSEEPGSQDSDVLQPPVWKHQPGPPAKRTMPAQQRDLRRQRRKSLTQTQDG